MTKEWGNITWKFFHTLAEKINPIHFDTVKPKILSILYELSGNLPCPDCSNHAQQVLKEGYYYKIKNKEHLILFIQQFHNIVNIKLNLPVYYPSSFQYKNNNLFNIYKEMIYTFSKYKSTGKLMSHNFKRNIYLEKLNNDLIEIKYSLL